MFRLSLISSIQIEGLEFQLSTARESKCALQTQVGDLQSRLNGVLEVQQGRASRRIGGGKELKPGKREKGNAATTVTLGDENFGGASAEEMIGSPKRGLGDVTNAVAQAAPSSNGHEDGSPKRSRLSQRSCIS